jgi:MFS family permease
MPQARQWRIIQRIFTMFDIARLFRSPQPVPLEHRRNFIHLYFDIGWWGLLNGSVLVFLSIYASRLGASTFQLGLLTAAPALVNLAFTFPAGALTRKWSSGKAVRWSALVTRLFYFLLIPLPILLPASTQVWVIILITLVMTIPGVVVGVLFNAFFAEVTPPEWRGQVVGLRNAIFAITTMATSLLCGLALNTLPFSTGYQVVFAIGFVGAMMSTLHLFLINPPEPEPLPPAAREKDPAHEEVNAAEKAPLHASRWDALRLDVLRGSFAPIIWITFLFQTSLTFIGPVVPRYQVDMLRLSDQTISLGSAVFWVMNFAGSLQVRRLANRWGFQRMTAYGLLIVSLTLIIFTYSYQTWIYLLHQVIGGVGFAIMNGGMINYILEKVPVNDRFSHLAWYNLAINASVLLSGLIAPPVAGAIGIMATLLGSVALRVVVAWLILKQKEGVPGDLRPLRQQT